MRKLNEIKGYVRNTLDKLPGIRVDLARLDKNPQLAYCEKDGYKSSECKIVECVSDLRIKLSEKKLRFNCTGSTHKV